MRKINYEIENGIRVEDLVKVIEYFDADCIWSYNFYCNKMTYPIFNPVYTHRLALNFTFPFEIDEEFIAEFHNLLSSIDIWEAREA